MTFFELSNQCKMPALGIGTFLLSPEEAERSVLAALKDGYRLVDTANAYVNERAVGRAIRNSGVVRSELFVSTKLWPTEYENEKAVDETLERLGLEYVDLLFLHQPAGNWKAGYKLLEKAYKEGKIKAIGISNFEGESLNELLNNCEIKPHVIQAEAHPYFWNKEVRRVAAIHDIQFMSWYPLGHGDTNLLKEPILTTIANNHQKTVAQIILKWHIQCGMVVIPGSKNPDHIRENFELFDFELTDSEMNMIASLHKEERYCLPSEDNLQKYATFHLNYEEK